jgi:hypothetical protein
MTELSAQVASRLGKASSQLIGLGREMLKSQGDLVHLTTVLGQIKRSAADLRAMAIKEKHVLLGGLCDTIVAFIELLMDRFPTEDEAMLIYHQLESLRAVFNERIGADGTKDAQDVLTVFRLVVERTKTSGTFAAPK